MAMKDSGIQWIGEIPENWEIKKLKYLYKIGLGLTHTPEYVDNGIPFISVKDISSGKLDLDNLKYISEEEFKMFPEGAIPRKGDILFGRVATLGCPVIFKEDFDVGMFVSLGKLTRKKDASIDNGFMSYWMKSSLFDAEMYQYIAGSAQLNLNTDWMKRFLLILPPLPEQKLIADFLDDKVGKIDDILTDLNNQVNILQKYKKSLITETVTKGLNPNATMKDSGIQWIGEIPENWKISKLKYVSSFVNGDRGNNYPSGNDMVDEGVIFVTSNNIHGTYLDTSPEISKYITEERYNLLGGAKIEVGDIIFCLRGSVGICSINNTEHRGTIASSLVDIKPKSINSRFMNYFLQSNISEIQTSLFTNGSCAANLSAENVSNYYFIEPNEKEQKLIADFLDEKCAQIDAIMKDKQTQIEKMENYKKSLIYEYVTGKKRVKGAEI